MTKRKFNRILNDCLSRMDRGESLKEILSVYPELVERLRPLLMTAMLSRALPPPVPGYTALRLGKNELFAEMEVMRAQKQFLEPRPVQPAREKLVDRLAGSLQQLKPAYRLAMLSVVVIMTGGFFTLSASASGMADQVLQTLFYSFEQVGDLLLVRPNLVGPGGEESIFSGRFALPDSPEDYSGDYKVVKLGEGKETNDSLDGVDQEKIETRLYTLSNIIEIELDLTEEILDPEILTDKELEKEEKEADKEEDKEEKEADKEEDKAEKAADKEEKEADKEADKLDKILDKEDKKADKD